MTAAVQVSAILAATGTANIVAVAIAGVSTRRVALPIAMIIFAAATALIDFAAELRRVAATVMLGVAASATGIATGVAIIATAADETIHHAVFLVAAMATAVGGEENSDDDGETSKLMCKHGELPPGNLEPRNRWKRLSERKAIDRSQRANESDNVPRT